MSSGFDINWSLPKGNTGVFKNHPLYIKYSSSTFGTININAVKSDLLEVMATAGSDEVTAYLCWLIRITNLTAP